jgi:acyl-CoA synthetase (NDP forming)
MFARTTAARRGDAASGAGDGRPLGVCVYAISGGTGAHMADLLADAGLVLPELGAATQRALQQWIPPYLRVSNPVDSGGPPSTDERGPRILEALIADPEVDLIICPITGALDRISRPLATDLVAAATTTDKPIFVVWGSPDTSDPVYTEVLLPSSLPTFRTFHNCVAAARAYADRRAFRAGYESPFAPAAVRSLLERSPAAAVVEPLLAGEGALDERRAKQVLQAYGIATTTDLLATSATAAGRAATTIGFPVVMKICSPDLPHKSDHGLVEIGVASAADARRAFARLVERAQRTDPAARIEGVLVSELVTGGVECVVGLAADELFGPTVMFGLGGVFVEVLRDVTFRVPPFGRREAERMLLEVQGAPLLLGARGRAPADLGALADVIMAVQRLALDHGDRIAEIDINPLVARADGAVALDALVVLHQPT